MRVQCKDLRRFLTAYAIASMLLLNAQRTLSIEAPPLKTEWTDAAMKPDPLSEYPRPEMVRSSWISLNGDWNYRLSTVSGPMKLNQSGVIRVPFPIESFLSGVQAKFSAQHMLEYSRHFSIPSDWKGSRILLHFDAVNWEARVALNGKQLGIHRGAYDHFSFDITDELSATSDQELTVYVTNPGNHGRQLRGKQSFLPNKIWYTSCSGIWQSVWLEPVPRTSIESLQLKSDVDNERLKILVNGRGETTGLRVEAIGSAGAKRLWQVVGKVGETLELPVHGAELWSPENPVLYDLKVSLIKGGKTEDVVSSYFGMRKISIAKDVNGIPRIGLNNKPYFQLGLLDQGYWPDGLYTAPSDEALRFDIETIKRLGFNTCRKHVKIEPERWYYWCDKLGLLVWQDIPSAGDSAAPSPKEELWPIKDAQQFESEVKEIVGQNANHPAVVMWIAFNQGWGQHDTTQTVNDIKLIDPCSLVVSASGWNDRGIGDVRSIHGYPSIAVPKFEDARPIVYGECGGIGLSLPEHEWPKATLWGYDRCDSNAEFTEAYSRLLKQIEQARHAGASGATITEFSDVEGEINGALTYDRKIVKVAPIVNGIKELSQE